MNLVTVTTTAVISALIMMGLMRQVSHIQKAERGVAANSDLAELTTTVRLILQSKDACERSGLIGTDVSPLLANPPTPVTVALALPGTNGPGIPFVQAGYSMWGSRKVDSVQLVRLTPLGTPGAGRYFANLEITTSLQGEALTFRNPKLKFNLALDVNEATQRIVSCAAEVQTGGLRVESNDYVTPSICDQNNDISYGFYCDVKKDAGRGWVESVQFAQPFNAPPKVIVSMIDPNNAPDALAENPNSFYNANQCGGGAIDGLTVRADDVTATGFTLVCNGNPLNTCADSNGISFGWGGQRATCSWMAVGF